MNKPDEAFKTFVDAAWRGDLAVIRALVAAGFDRSATNQYGEPVLSEVISELSVVGEMQPHRYDVVRTLLELGFDPNQLDDEDMGPMTEAMLAMDTEMLRMLLDAGARPNETAGFGANSTLYDWAVDDYVYEVWDINKFPDEPTENDLANEDDWLTWLDKMAVAYERRRPDHLLLLRERGARCWSELHKNTIKNEEMHE